MRLENTPPPVHAGAAVPSAAAPPPASKPDPAAPAASPPAASVELRPGHGRLSRLVEAARLQGEARPAAETRSPEAMAEGEETEPGTQAKETDSPLEQEQLSEEEKREVERLKDRDREVRAHEQAHLAAAGPYARGGPHYEYERGPDNRRYAVGGEVSIDTSPVSDDPEATIAKAQTIRRAALAPAEPSPQDRRVAAEASRMEAKARQELAQKRLEEGRESAPPEDAAEPVETPPEEGRESAPAKGPAAKFTNSQPPSPQLLDLQA